MRILHTADWHVGRSIRGRSRLTEQRTVLGEIVEIVRQESVDLVLVAGDLFESAAPSPDAEGLVWETLLGFRKTGARVVAIAGNHDSAHRFEALRPVMEAAGITLTGMIRRPDDGGVTTVVTGSGERARIALLPFLSQRYVVRAADLMAQDAAANAGTYAERMRLLLQVMGEALQGGDAVNLVLAHCFVRGGRLGGGERDAQTVFDYWVDGTAFPSSVHYVALGHLHRMQEMSGSPAVRYSGSPIQVDFGEADERKYVLLVEAEPGAPARVREIPLAAGRRLRTLTGNLAELRRIADSRADDDAYLRVFVREHARAGLADEVTEILPHAVQVLIDPEMKQAAPAVPTRTGRSPRQLFSEFLTQREIEDPRLEQLFARLLDEELARERHERKAP